MQNTGRCAQPVHQAAARVCFLSPAHCPSQEPEKATCMHDPQNIRCYKTCCTCPSLQLKVCGAQSTATTQQSSAGWGMRSMFCHVCTSQHLNQVEDQIFTIKKSRATLRLQPTGPLIQQSTCFSFQLIVRSGSNIGRAQGTAVSMMMMGIWLDSCTLPRAAEFIRTCTHCLNILPWAATPAKVRQRPQLQYRRPELGFCCVEQLGKSWARMRRTCKLARVEVVGLILGHFHQLLEGCCLKYLALQLLLGQAALVQRELLKGCGNVVVIEGHSMHLDLLHARPSF